MHDVLLHNTHAPKWEHERRCYTAKKTRPCAHHFSVPPTSFPCHPRGLTACLSFLSPSISLYTLFPTPYVGPMATYDTLDSTRSPYGSGDPYYNSSSGYITPANPKKSLSKSKWIMFGVPVGVLVIAGAVVGAVLATRHHGHNSSSKNSGSPSAASSAVSAKNAVGIFATATDSEFMVPLYPSTVRLAQFHVLQANFSPFYLTDKYCCLLYPHV